MPKHEISKLEPVELRMVWQGEATDFTPWLAEAENLSLLADAIGMELELEGIERDIGPYSADILCQDVADGRKVVIENQLEKTDHDHLGKALTYAAGLDASTVIWIAARFNDQHRAALDWLNRNTSNRLNFFGIEIEAWKIGESKPAIRFQVVCRPNDWAGTLQATVSQEISELGRLRLEYWTEYVAFLQTNTTYRSHSPGHQPYIHHKSGRSGMHYSACASTYDTVTGRQTLGEIRMELVLHDLKSKEYFAALESQKGQIEAQLGGNVHWHNQDGTRQCRIFVRSEADLANKRDWPKQFKWFVDKLELFHNVFDDRIRSF